MMKVIIRTMVVDIMMIIIKIKGTIEAETMLNVMIGIGGQIKTKITK